jgi:hypothetical protein
MMDHFVAELRARIVTLWETVNVVPADERYALQVRIAELEAELYDAEHGLTRANYSAMTIPTRGRREAIERQA